MSRRKKKIEGNEGVIGTAVLEREIITITRTSVTVVHQQLVRLVVVKKKNKKLTYVVQSY